MAEIQNETARGSGGFGDAPNAREDLFAGLVKRAGVEVALEARAIAHSAGGFGDLDPPIQGEHVCTGFDHLIEYMCAIVHVEDERCSVAIKPRRDLGMNRQHPLPVLGGPEQSRPGVEELDDLAPASIWAFR